MRDFPSSDTAEEPGAHLAAVVIAAEAVGTWHLGVDRPREEGVEPFSQKPHYAMDRKSGR